MEKVTLEDGQSADIVGGNIEKLQGLFPDAFREGQIDFGVLRQLLGDASVLSEGEEKYGLNWHGKKKARQIALTPSAGTLLPCPTESEEWNETQNLFIEGDNLEVLKLLQKSYAGKVKMIYIDPPYNTGKEFIYPDRFQDNLDTYLKYTGQIDGEGLKLSSNTEAGGRKHTNWLSMMHPRLRLARELLSQDGSIYITIDDNEVENLILLCNEIFGEENFVTTISWQKKVSPSNDATWFSNDHDHILLYAKNKEIWRPSRLEMNERQRGYYKNPDNDPRGDWNSATYTCNKNKYERPNLYYPITNPNTGEEVWPNETAVWAYSREATEKNLEEGRLYWGKDGKSTSPRLKNFLTNAKGVVPRTVWLYNDVGHTQEATKELKALLPDAQFETPKPTRLIRRMIAISASDPDSLILDFFAGSCSTAHATMLANAEDGGSRRCISVQLPEEIERGPYSTIAEIGKARLRKAGEAIAAKSPDAPFDRGFKVFKLSHSSIRAWSPDKSDLEGTLLENQSHLLEGRDESDLLFELLLKRGVELSTPIETRTIDGISVHSVGFGVLFACLSGSIKRKDVDGLAQGILDWHKELEPETDTHVFFRDSAFEDDIAKTNMAAILEQTGITHVRSL